MQDLSLHILDIAENAIRSGATIIEIAIVEEPKHDLLTVEVNDNGKGMDQETVRKSTDPFFTTQQSRRVGLGLPMLAAAAREANGNMVIESEPNRGTKIKATFKHSHIDRKPLGSMEETLIGLIACNPAVNFKFSHRRGLREYRVDTAETKIQLGITMMNVDLAFKIMEDYARFLKEN